VASANHVKLVEGFPISAIWDPTALVYYSDSGITGLHIEAPTVEEFYALADELAPELIRANDPVTPRGSRPLRGTSP
jgi:hypothetical protein